MNVCIDPRKLFLFLLITAVVNADRIKEGTLPYDINVRCVALDASFDIVFCEGGFIISVIDAHYGYYTSNRDVGLSESCSIQLDCLVSVPLRSTSYYDQILVGCNGKERCDNNLEAERYDGWTLCDPFTLNGNDYVSIQFYCLPSDVTSRPTLVPTSTTSWRTSATPSTVPATSVANGSPASSTTGGATIASDASTYTVIDNLGNVSSIVTEPTSSKDDTMSIIVGCVVGGVVLIILLLLLIFIVWRRRNSEDASKRRGNNSAKGVNGISPNGVTTMVKCDTPQGRTHSDKEYDATPLSDNNNIPTYSLGSHPATALYDLAQDLPQPPVYWLAQEPSIPADTLAREPLADFYSEVEDLAEEPYLSLYSNSGFSKEIGKSNPGIYVNVTEPSNAAYSLVQKTNSSTHQKVEDRVGSASMPVSKFEFTNKVRIDKEEEKVSALTRHQAVQRPEDDLVVRDNSLYVATETHSPNDAVDELTLTENDLYV